MTSKKEEFVEKQADFSINFFRQTQLNGLKSTILSPVLIKVGLIALNNDALNENQRATDEDNSKDLKENFANLWKELQTLKTSKFQLNVINRIYIKNGLKLDKKFTENLEKYFGEDIIHQLESNNYEEERKKINNSVKVLTNKLMPEIIPSESIDSSTQIFLINAIHFYGEFIHQFLPDTPFSTPQKFYVTKDIVRYITFMQSQQLQYFYESNDDYEVVGLEYVGDCKMFIIIPKQRFGLSKIIKNLNGSTLIKLSKNNATKLLEITLPKFTCNTNIDAVEVFKNIEKKSVVNVSTSVDFTSLLNNDSSSMLFQHLFHQTFIQVNPKEENEKDFVNWRSSSTGPGCPEPDSEVLVKADHPFLYFISDKNSNIIFIGSVVDDFQPDAGEVFYTGPRLFKFLSTVPQKDRKFIQEIPSMKLEPHQKGHYFINPFLKFTKGFEKYATNEWILVQMEKLAYKIVNRVILNEETKIANPYSGLGGIVYALLKAQKYFDKNFSDEILQICGQYMNTQHFFGDRIAAYYMYLDGNLGLHVVNSIFHFIKNESNDISKIIKKVAAQKYSRHHAINKGRCGLLAAILTLKLEANQETNLDDKVLQEVLSNVINVGLEFSKEHSMEAPLSYSEDKNLGFLNGLYGILQMLLSFWDSLDDIQKGYVEDTVNWLINGNDETAPPPAKKKKDDSPPEGTNEIYGKCQLFIKSYLVFGEQKYLNAANKCCDEIWEHGISNKNVGLDNGISGNGYAFLLMYRLTKDDQYLIKAKIFALILLDSEFEKQIPGSENPFSLFQGWAGVSCFLSDLMDPHNAQFPFIPILFNNE